MHKLQNDRNFH